MAERLTEDQERQRATWQYRCVQATRGSQSQLGAILLAVLGMQRNTLPRFEGQCTITSDGFVLCRFRDRNNVVHHGAFVGSVNDLVGNFSGLADHLRLADADRIALFKAVRDWIALDCRPGDQQLHFTVTRR